VPGSMKATEILVPRTLGYQISQLRKWGQRAGE
jgi:hypothetical protein